MALSDTLAVKVYIAAAVGVPLNTPAAVMVTPGGGDPETIDQLYGGTPPTACSVRMYATPTVLGARNGCGTPSGGGFTVSEKPLVPEPP